MKRKLAFKFQAGFLCLGKAVWNTAIPLSKLVCEVAGAADRKKNETKACFHVSYGIFVFPNWPVERNQKKKRRGRSLPPELLTKPHDHSLDRNTVSDLARFDIFFHLDSVLQCLPETFQTEAFTGPQ